MFDFLDPATPHLTETQRRREDRPATLSGLHRACDKAASITHTLDMVQDRNFGVSGQNEVAVHAVHGKVVRHGSHCRRQ